MEDGCRDHDFLFEYERLQSLINVGKSSSSVHDCILNLSRVMSCHSGFMSAWMELCYEFVRLSSIPHVSLLHRSSQHPIMMASRSSGDASATWLASPVGESAPKQAEILMARKVFLMSVLCGLIQKPMIGLAWDVQTLFKLEFF